MINRLRLLRNIGKFDSVNSANIPLTRVTLMYAENGRGKTTLAAILRSLATSDPIPIVERQRLGAQNPPHVIIDCDGGHLFAGFDPKTRQVDEENVLLRVEYKAISKLHLNHGTS